MTSLMALMLETFGLKKKKLLKEVEEKISAIEVDSFTSEENKEIILLEFEYKGIKIKEIERCIGSHTVKVNNCDEHCWIDDDEMMVESFAVYMLDHKYENGKCIVGSKKVGGASVKNDEKAMEFIKKKIDLIYFPKYSLNYC